MSNQYLYKIMVKGSKKSCEALVYMMPSYDKKYNILAESKIDNVYTLVFSDFYKKDIDVVLNNCDNIKKLSQEKIENVKNFSDYWDCSLMEKSILLDCEIFCNKKNINNNEDSLYTHFNKGNVILDECPENIKIINGIDYNRHTPAQTKYY